jgi:hypothetical protein
MGHPDRATKMRGRVMTACVSDFGLGRHSNAWTSDRDFAGTGVASWSTPNLIRALREADA